MTKSAQTMKLIREGLLILCLTAGLSPAVAGGRKAGTVRVVDLGGGVTMTFVWCPPGHFMMGSSGAQQERALQALPADLPPASRKSTGEAIRKEGPAHRVAFRKGFWLARTEVTQAQWQQVLGSNPSKFKDAGMDAPAETVSWDDGQAFLARLNAGPARSGRGAFRLPTEAEWEYACRAGARTTFSFGDEAGKLGDYAWFVGNSGMKTHPVAQKKPNAWGLYDMHGNVWEWCADWFAPYPAGAANDPAGPVAGHGRVGRGGGWDDFAGDCRSAYRSFGRPPSFKASPLGLRPVWTKE